MGFSVSTESPSLQCSNHTNIVMQQRTMIFENKLQMIPWCIQICLHANETHGADWMSCWPDDPNRTHCDRDASKQIHSKFSDIFPCVSRMQSGWMYGAWYIRTELKRSEETWDETHKICFCSKQFSTQFSIVQQESSKRIFLFIHVHTVSTDGAYLLLICHFNSIMFSVHIHVRSL